MFESLVHRHRSAVTAYALALTRNRWQAEEAVQETFVRAWKYLDSFRGDGCFEGWLLRICRNVVSSNAAAAAKAGTVVAAINPDVQTVELDASAEVVQLLSNLPLPQREAMTLCGILGYPYESAAEILGVPVGTIRSRVSRGRANLAEQLQEETA